MSTGPGPSCCWLGITANSPPSEPAAAWTCSPTPGPTTSSPTPAEWERSASLRLRAGDENVLHDYHRHGRLLDAGTTEQAEASAARAWLADTLAGKQSLLVVDTNEQAANVSAGLRAELIRLGRVQDQGVHLGLDGTFAGVGDVIQARHDAWHLTGLEGNRRGPLNREKYRVTAIRPRRRPRSHHRPRRGRQGAGGADGTARRLRRPARRDGDNPVGQWPFPPCVGRLSVCGRLCCG
jgi:hypothetical protein